MSFSSVQRRALVLGGRGDIGSAIVAALDKQGLAAQPVGRTDFDLTKTQEIDNFLASEGKAWDVLVHSAGHNQPAAFETLADDDIRYSLEANLHGFLHLSRACLPHWRMSGGRIVVVSSLYGQFARKNRLPYVIAKHSLVGAVKTLAIELAPYGVLVNAVSPGFIGTKMTYSNNSPERIARLTTGIPLGRLGKPEDIAEVVSFLCSPLNRYLTGHDLVVDGGFSCGGFQEMI